ncbi:hypothetical protein MTQ16_09760 [Corynebacterium bovis]|uniref:hypothetical protein n=1 Tax=Corynebacterium bovis TaxID=36808 RepID=UPI00313958CC
MKGEWTLEGVRQSAERIAGEAIVFIEVPPTAVSGVCGSRLKLDSTQFLFVPAADRDAGSLMKEIVATHEIAHVLCKHTSLSRRNAHLLVDSIRERWPGVPIEPGWFPVDDERAYDDEREAELLSTLILREAKPCSDIGEELNRKRKSQAVGLSILFGGKIDAKLNH